MPARVTAGSSLAPASTSCSGSATAAGGSRLKPEADSAKSTCSGMPAVRVGPQEISTKSRRRLTTTSGNNPPSLAARSAWRIHHDLPVVLPASLPLAALVHRRRREPGRPQRLPGGVAEVPRRQAFLVKQGIPVRHEPLDQREQVPVHGFDALARFPMRAQVPAFDPELETAPGERDVGIGGLSAVGVLAERQCQREGAGVPGEPLPAGTHKVTNSVPMFPKVAPADAAFVDPSAPEGLRNPDPADRVPVPDVRAVPPRAVRTALVNGVPRAIDRHTVVEQAC